jgi:very-short-patch-repair endonuclease
LKLIIEVDGEHHLSEEGRRRDQRRDAYLKEHGYEVLRIPGYQVVRDAAGVRSRIEQAIDQRVKQKSPSTPTPLPGDQGEHHSP